jgi:ABC-type transport system substrate-binding protein
MVAKTKVIMDSAKRFESALKIQNIVHEDAIYLFLYNGMDSYGVAKKVRGFEARSDEMMDLWNVSLE